MIPLREDLLAIAKKYWRADKAYAGSIEHRRLMDLWDEELKKMGQWWIFLDELKKELPGFTVGNATATPDACFRCAAYSPGDAPGGHRFVVVGCVSILAPVYVVYGMEYVRMGRMRTNSRIFFEPLPGEMRHSADVVSRRIEAFFRVDVLPRDIAEALIPLHVEPIEPPNTTFFHALFTSEPESLP